MMTRYPLLQSGFINRKDFGLSSDKPAEDHPVRPLLSRPLPTNSQAELFYSPAFEALFKNYIAEPTSFNQVKSQEELFRLVGELFGDQHGWASFVKHQENNPTLSHLHVQFMEEVTQVLTGAASSFKTSLPLWASLLSAANPAAREPFRVDRAQVQLMNESKSFGHIFAQSGNIFLHRLGETAACFVGNQGLGQLMLLLKVIYGRRTVHATKGRAPY
jgi:hypothetical protein